MNRHIGAKRDIRSFGDPRRPFALKSGWAVQYHDQLNGTRQITGIMFPGEYWNGTSDLGIQAVTDCEVSWRVDTNNASRTGLLTQIDDRETQMKWLLTLGVIDCATRLCLCLSMIFNRLRELDLVRDSTATIPLRQIDFAAAICVTPVHLNRTMRRLERDQVLRRVNRDYTILDHEFIAKADRTIKV